MVPRVSTFRTTIRNQDPQCTEKPTVYITWCRYLRIIVGPDYCVPPLYVPCVLDHTCTAVLYIVCGRYSVYRSVHRLQYFV